MGLDLAIVALYLVGITVFGVWIGRKQGGTPEGYFLGGRQFTWVMIGFSLFATNITGTQFMGLPGLSHKIGIAASNNDLIGGLMLGVSAIFFIPLYLRCRLYTIPEFLEKRFGRTAKLIFGVTFVIQGIMASPMGFYAGGLGFLSLFNLSPDYLPAACLVVGVTVGLYAITGGLTSIVYTDLVQTSLLVGGAAVVLVAGLIKVGGFGVLHAEMGETHFRLLLPADNPHLPWTAVIGGVVIHSAFYSFCSASVLQRALGAKDVRHAQLGMLCGAYLKVGTLLVLAVPGIIAAKLYPGINPDSAMAVMIRDLLPIGLTGLVLAGLMSAVMSNADSSVVAIGSVVALDILPAVKRNPSERTALAVGRITAALILVFGIATAPYLAKFGQIYPLILRITAFMALPVGTCFLCGRFCRRVNNAGAIATLVFGLITGVVYVLGTAHPDLQALMPAWLVRAHFYNVVPILFALYVAMLFGVSWLTKPPPAELLAVLDLEADRSLAEGQSVAWYRGFRFWWLAFIALVVLLYLLF